MGASEFCRLHGWTPEKYRKVAQRARARLQRLDGSSRSSCPVLSRARRKGKQGPTYDHLSPHS